MFFTDNSAKAAYKAYITSLLNHANTVNGRRYCDDDTIMSLGLLNEPRCEQYKASS